MVIPGPAVAPVPTPPDLRGEARDGMLAELHARGLGVAGPLLVLALVALRRSLRYARTRPLPALREALAGLDVGLRASALDGGGAIGVAQDCADIAAWLERRCALLTACGYAEAAVALDAAKPEHALAVSRLARGLGRMGEAVEWGVRAWRLAGRARDADTRAAALVALGQTAAAAQRYGDAARVLALALRHALAHGAAERAGDALREMALVRHAQERDEEALDLVVQALAAYGARIACVQALARTLLAMWVESSEYPGAVLLGKLLLSLPLVPGDELAVCALLARAGAALGWELSYESFCLRAILSLARLSPESPHAGPMLDLARAHGALGFWPRVLLAADRALADAQEHGDHEAVGVSRRMLEAAELEAIPPEVQADLFPDHETEEIPEGEEPPAWHPVAVAVASFRVALAGA
jgi:hypothetical protein